MKTTSSGPVIFRSYGRMKSTTTYHLPDFLFTYIIAGHGSIGIAGEQYNFTTESCFVITRYQEAVVTLLPGEDNNACFHAIHIRISEDEVEDYFLHSTVPSGTSALTNAPLQLLPDHPMLHGLSLLLEDGIRRGFRATWTFTKMKIQECIHILVAINKQMYNWFSACNHLQKINLRIFMEKNFRRNIPLEKLACAAGRSLSTFRRDFQLEFGTTPTRWLIARRLDEAQRLIRSGQRPCEIIIELGFESFSHFTRCYKVRFSRLPSEERQNESNIKNRIASLNTPRRSGL